jgi:hypothetical protein
MQKLYSAHLLIGQCGQLLLQCWLQLCHLSLECLLLVATVEVEQMWWANKKLWQLLENN